MRGIREEANGVLPYQEARPAGTRCGRLAEEGCGGGGSRTPAGPGAGWCRVTLPPRLPSGRPKILQSESGVAPRRGLGSRGEVGRAAEPGGPRSPGREDPGPGGKAQSVSFSAAGRCLRLGQRGAAACLRGPSVTHSTFQLPELGPCYVKCSPAFRRMHNEWRI